MPEQLLAAVLELTRVVKALENTLKNEYPKRREIEANYVNRTETRKRRNQFVIFVVIAIVASYFFTITTISGCFLSEGARTGHAPSACSILPGYDRALKRNDKIVKQFEHLIHKTNRNSHRLDKIERQLRR